jgi:hypothetical protein
MKLLLCSGNLTNSIFRSITVLKKYSLNKIHVGANLNRDETIQNLSKGASEKNKNNS